MNERSRAYQGRVAFLTGDVSSHDLELLEAEAEIPVLQKPYEPEKLRAVLEQLGCSRD